MNKTYTDLIRTLSNCWHALRCIKPPAKCSLLPALLWQIVSKMSLCMYVYMCVCVECACVHASFRSARRIIPDIATSCQQSSVWSNFTWCSYIWAYTKHLPLETERNVTGVGRWWKVHSLTKTVLEANWEIRPQFYICDYGVSPYLHLVFFFSFFWNRSLNLEWSEHVRCTADQHFYWFHGSGKNC